MQDRTSCSSGWCCSRSVVSCQLHAAANVIIGKLYNDSAQIHAPTAHAQAPPVNCLHKSLHEGNAMQWQTDAEARGLHLRMLCTSSAPAFPSCADDEGMTAPSTVSALRPAPAAATPTASTWTCLVSMGDHVQPGKQLRLFRQDGCKEVVPHFHADLSKDHTHHPECKKTPS